VETQILIMCQGSQSRLPDLDRPKQLLEVAGEPLLVRTHRLVRELCPGAAITTIGRAALERASDVLVTLPDPGNCIVDGIEQTRWCWGRDRTVVLLGDVAFSRAALAGIFADERQFFFAGTADLSPSGGEVFGFSVRDRVAAWVQHIVGTCPCREINYSKAQGGHLRRLLWWAQRELNLRPASNHQAVVGPKAEPVPLEEEQTWCRELYRVVDDWTCDFDTPTDLEKLPEISDCATAEERC
jgi:hypothetical protein